MATDDFVVGGGGAACRAVAWLQQSVLRCAVQFRGLPIAASVALGGGDISSRGFALFGPLVWFDHGVYWHTIIMIWCVVVGPDVA